MAVAAKEIQYLKPTSQKKYSPKKITAKIEGIDYTNGNLLVRTKEGKSFSFIAIQYGKHQTLFGFSFQFLPNLPLPVF